MLEDGGSPCTLGLHDRVMPVEHAAAVAVRDVGSLGTEAVAGVTVNWSTRGTPCLETATSATVLTPAFKSTCREDSRKSSKLPVIRKRCVLVMVSPFTRRPI